MKWLFILLFIFCIFLFIESCKHKQVENSNVSVVCLRDADTIYIRIANNSKYNIYIPKRYIGTFNADNDTIALEILDKPKYNTNYYYGYKNVFPFEVVTAQKINGYSADTVIKITKQTYYFNQFKSPSFKTIKPDSFVVESIIFNVPKRSNIVKLVFYKKVFSDNENIDSLSYSFEKFVQFDSINANYATAPIINRFYMPE